MLNIVNMHKEVLGAGASCLQNLRERNTATAKEIQQKFQLANKLVDLQGRISNSENGQLTDDVKADLLEIRQDHGLEIPEHDADSVARFITSYLQRNRNEVEQLFTEIKATQGDHDAILDVLKKILEDYNKLMESIKKYVSGRF